MILLIYINSYILPFSSSYLHPYLYDQGCTNFHCDATCRPHSLYIHFMPSFHFTLLYPFTQLYIADHIYTHVIFP